MQKRINRVLSVLLTLLMLVTAVPLTGLTAFADEGEEHTHSFTAERVDDKYLKTAATCTEKAVYFKSCSECEEKGTETFESGVARGHDLEDSEIVTPATCTAAGSKTLKCKREGCEHTEPGTIPATNHANAEDKDETPATCKEKGFTAGSYCPDCETWLSGHEEIAKLAHTWNDGVVTKTATCTQAGEETFTCTRTGCGETEIKPIPATGEHSFTAEKDEAKYLKTAATCTEKAVYFKSCSECEEKGTDTFESGVARGHDWDAGVVTTQPSCTEEGVKTFKCTRTGCTETKTEAITAKGHTPVTDAAVAPTCTKTGLTEGTYCSVCEATITEQESVAALGHKWDDKFTIDKEPTAAAAGSKSKHCTRSGCDEKTEVTEIPKILTVTISKGSAAIYIGDTLNLSVDTNYESGITITWTSSNLTVATVDTTGKVTPVANGTAKIKATVKAGEQEKDAECEVTVKTHVTGVTLDKTSATMQAGETLTLNATVSPAAASDKEVTWSSKNEAVATVDNDGKVTAVKGGTARITVTTVDGNKTAYCDVRVKIAVTDVKLDSNSVTMNLGSSRQLVATVSPADADDKGVTWKSSDTSVVTVDGNGRITAKAQGQATITVTTDEGDFKASCIVTVVIPVTSVSLDVHSALLVKGEIRRLTATVSPENATNKSVVWKSSDPAVATVDANGVVTPLRTGNATITVTTADGGFTDTCNVIIVIPVTGVKLDETTVTMKLGETHKLNKTIIPANATNQKVIWSSDDEAVAKVDSNGVVTPVFNGNATITVTTDDGSFTASCEIIVETKVTGLTIDTTALTLMGGETSYITANVQPDTASNRDVVWTSSSPETATVSYGYVKAVAPGTAIITAKTVDGAFEKTCVVKVIVPATGITLTPETATVYIGTMKYLTATVTPATASDVKMTWSSSDTSVATVNSLGGVTGIKNGTATITVSARDNGVELTASCEVTVVTSVEGVRISKAFEEIKIGDTCKLEATVMPSTAIDRTVIWSSSDENIATVDSEGVVVGIAAGEAIITVTTGDGKWSSECKITVITPVSGVTLSNTSAAINVGSTKVISATVAPEQATYKTVTWSTGDPKIATVSEQGVITAVSVGKTVITATTTQGGLTASCEVTVVIPVSGVTLDQLSATLYIGSTCRLNATVMPENAANRSVIWYSSDTSVATVNAGLVTAVSDGTATISAVTEDGGYTAVCSISVRGTEGGQCGTNAVWTFESKSATLTVSGSGSMKDFTFKDEVPWAKYINNIKIVSIEGGINNVGNYAFTDCKSLTAVTLAPTVDKLGKYCFSGCTALTQIDLPAGAKRIEQGAFNSCEALSDIILPGKVEYIGVEAFDGTLLNTITINNRDCYIFPQSNTISDMAVICAASGSTAHKYAKAFNREFVPIAECEHVDADADLICENCGECSISAVTVTGLRVSSITSNTLTLSWTAVPKATGYRVYMYNPETKKYEGYKNITANSLNVTGLTANSTVYFKVRAYKKIDSVNYWGVASTFIRTYTGPAQVANLRASVTSSSIKLVWNKTAGAAGYRVFKYNATTKKYEAYKTLTENTLTVTGLKANSLHYFKVSAYRKVSGVVYWGSQSSFLRTYTGPVKAAGLKVSGYNTTSLKLVWNKVSGATGYRVYKYNPTTKTYEAYKNTTANSITVTGLKAATVYYFKVRAYRTINSVNYWGDTSDFIRTATRPLNGSITSAASTAKNSLTVKSSKVNGVTGYAVQYSLNKNFSGVTTKYTASQTATYKGLSSGKTYYVRIRPYVMMNGVRIYSPAYSAVKAVKIK